MNWFSIAFLASLARTLGTRARSLSQELVSLWASWRRPTYTTRIVADHLPKTLRDRTLYVVEDDGYKEQAAMLCPCGCGRTLHMNLLPDERPCWQLMLHGDGTSSLHPSVWRQKDCYSHFWFKRGRIIWAKDSPPAWEPP